MSNNEFSSKRFVSVAYVISLLFLHFSSAGAQEVCSVPAVSNASDAIKGIDDLLQKNCLGGEVCQTDDCKLLTKLESGASVRSPNDRVLIDTKSNQILIAVRKLHDRAATLDESKLGVTQLRGMFERWDMPRLDGTSKEAIEIPTRLSNREWHGSGFDLFLHTPFELNLEKAFQAGACRNAQQCDSNFKSAVEVYTLSALVHRSLDLAVKDDIDSVGKMLQTYDARWTTFHTKSRAVFPWELVANNLSYKSASEGFSGPPNWQWLFLHPSAGVAYNDKQDDKMQEALLLDVIGRYWWTWGGKHDAEITRPLGVALAMSWTGDDPGYGVAVHMPQNWSIALTRSKGNQTQVLFSLEFAQFVTDKRKNVDSFREKLEALKLGK